MFKSNLAALGRWSSIGLILLLLVLLSLGCGSAEQVGPERKRGAAVADTVATLTEVSAVGPAIVEVPTDDPSADKPFCLGAVVHPNEAKAGDVVTLVVRGKIAEQWHIYAVNGPTGVARPTKLELTLPDSVSVAADWTLPTAEIIGSPDGPVSIYDGDVRFAVPLKIAQNAAAATIKIQCEVRYQACDDSRCLPPTSATLAVPLTIAPKKGP